MIQCRDIILNGKAAFPPFSITPEMFREEWAALEKAKDEQPFSLSEDLNRPVSQSDFDKNIVPLLQKLRDRAYEFMTFTLSYSSSMDFIQTASMGEGYRVEVAVYEPAGALKRCCFNEKTKPFRIWAIDDADLRDTIDYFCSAMVYNELPNMEGWRDVSEEIFEYQDQHKKESDQDKEKPD